MGEENQGCGMPSKEMKMIRDKVGNMETMGRDFRIMRVPEEGTYAMEQEQDSDQSGCPEITGNRK